MDFDRESSGRNDSGFTLLEVMVGMTLLSIFLAIFGGSLISMYKSVSRTQQTARAQTQLNQYFSKIDRQLRYATAISNPKAAVYTAGDYVVEFLVSYGSTTATCTQLRLAPSGDLQQRSWTQNNVSTMSAPTLIATGLTAGTPINTQGVYVSAAGPFAVIYPSGATNNQRLEVALNAADVGVSNARARQTDVTFTAINTGTTATSASTGTVCGEGRSVSWPSA